MFLIDSNRGEGAHSSYDNLFNIWFYMTNLRQTEVINKGEVAEMDKVDGRKANKKKTNKPDITIEYPVAKNLGRAEVEDRGKEDTEKGVILGIVAQESIAEELAMENLSRVIIEYSNREDIKKSTRLGITGEDLNRAVAEDRKREDIKKRDGKDEEKDSRSDTVAGDSVAKN